MDNNVAKYKVEDIICQSREQRISSMQLPPHKTPRGETEIICNVFGNNIRTPQLRPAFSPDPERGEGETAIDRGGSLRLAATLLASSYPCL